MRKIIALLLAVSFIFSFTGCGKEKEVPYRTTTTRYQYTQNNNYNNYSYTVYVSKYGKIHRNKNCSGMIYYTEMDYNTAVSRGYALCKNCYS